MLDAHRACATLAVVCALGLVAPPAMTQAGLNGLAFAQVAPEPDPTLGNEAAVDGAADPDAQAIDAEGIEAFIERARDYDIVVIGEIHDNPDHHAAQARIVAALQPAAIVFEMIAQEDEAVVNDLREAGATRSEIAEALEWEASGWPDFDFYAAILEAAPEARIFGAGQPLADVRRAMVEGAAGVFGPDARIYGIDQPLAPEEQALREAELAAAHCGALAPEVLPGMVEAQRFRDAGLADAALWARIMTGEGQVVVITGSAHADRQRGMPAMLELAQPETSVLSLGQFEGSVDNPEAFDAVRVAPAPERGDPCAAFPEPAE
jgi:uncharacterized iron-regulated protein